MKTAKDAYHAWRRARYREEHYVTVGWRGGVEILGYCARRGVYRLDRAFGRIPPHRYRVGDGFAELTYASVMGVTRPGLASKGQQAKASIRYALEIARKCPAPVLP